jgi:HEAT repeat protein
MALAAVLLAFPAAAGAEEKDPAKAKADAARWIEVLKKEPGNRKQAAVELGNLGAPAGAAIPALVSALSDRDEPTRVNATWALGKIAGPRYVPATFPFLPAYLAQHYPATEERKANAEPLKKLALPALMKALADGAPDQRVNAAFALGCMEELASDAAPLLARALLKDGDRRVRSNAAWALTKVKGEVGRILPALREAAGSKEEFVRQCACLAMGWFGPAAAPALPELFKAMDQEKGGKFSRKNNYLQVIAGMGAAGAPAIPRLAAMLQSPEPHEQASASWCLGSIRTGAAAHVGRLTELLASEHQLVRWNAAWALGRIGPDAKAAVPELRRLSEGDPDPAVKANALQALSIISGVAVPTGSSAPEPTGSGSGGTHVVSSGDTVEVVK